MKIKKYLIFLGLFMVLMCCVGAIGAATDDAMDIVSSDDLSSDYNGEQVIGVDENTPASIAQGPDESADPQISVDDPASPIEVGPCSFTEFNNKLWYGSVFSLTGNITRSENDWQEIGIGEGMNITIYGNGYTIDANKLGRCFVVYPGGELTLINVKLINGYLPPTLDRDFDGGAILNMGTLTIVDCEFRDNYARDGGAISCDKVATTRISGTTLFYNNKVWQDGGAIANGGGSTLIISGKTTFESNSAYYVGPAAIQIDEGKGGAILNAFASELDSSKKSYLYIEGETIFKDNTAYADGGAIFNHQAVANITGKNTFTNNKAVLADGKGGAINNENATLYLNGNNLFQSNEAFRGGAIDNSLFESVMTINGKNEFKNNRASMGGAISNQQAIRLNIYGENTFTDNHANFNSGSNIGGAIYSYQAYLYMDGTNIFMRNTANGPGGAIYLANSNFELKGNNIFDANSAPLGGAILLIESQRVDFNGNNKFNGNTAETSGGAVMAISVNQLILSNHNYFTNNKAIQGGAVYARNSVLDTQGSLFEGNIAGLNTKGYGGAIFLENTVTAIKYNIFKNNYASGTGPDIESYQSSIVSLDYNYWNSQSRPSQNQVHNYNVGNIGTWAILDLTVPSQIKQYEDTEIVRFKTNSYGNLDGEMPDYTVSVTPNFNPSNVVVTKNVGTSKYNGNTGQVTVTASSSNFGASRTVNVIPGKEKTILYGRDIILKDPSEIAYYEVTLADVNYNALAGKTIEITVDGKKYVKTTDSHGKVSLNLSNLENGCHEVVAKYAGEDKYFSANKITVIACIYENKSSNILFGKDVEMFYKDGTRYGVTLTDANGNPLANKPVYIYINGRAYNKTTDGQGNAFQDISLISGNYPVTAFCPDDDFVFCENTVNIKSTVSGNDIVKIFKNGTQYRANFVDKNGNPLKNTEVKFNINGVFYKRMTDENGTAQLDINLIPRTYTITAENTVTGENHANTVTVLPSIINNNDVDMYFKNGSQYKVTILGDDGKPVGAGVAVRFNINGIFYTRKTDENGTAALDINLPPRTYVITAEYNGLRASNTITVKSILSTSDLTMKYLDGSQFKAKLLDGQGRPYPNQNMTFNINGRLYKKLTNDEGIAALDIRLLPGEYIITSSFNGLNAANKVTITG